MTLITMKIRKLFSSNSVSIPFPQDVFIHTGSIHILSRTAVRRHRRKLDDGRTISTQIIIYGIWMMEG